MGKLNNELTYPGGKTEDISEAGSGARIGIENEEGYTIPSHLQRKKGNEKLPVNSTPQYNPQVSRVVNNIFLNTVEQSGKGVNDLTDDAHFRKHLGMKPAEVENSVREIEAEFGIIIPQKAIKNINTMGPLKVAVTVETIGGDVASNILKQF
jgi:hypothetical protein